MREHNIPIVGQQWKTRDQKRVFTIISVSSAGRDMPVMAVDNKKVVETFTREGFFVSPYFPNKNDLVERL